LNSGKDTEAVNPSQCSVNCV